MIVYVSAQRMPPGLAGTLPTLQSRRLVNPIILSEWDVLALLLLLDAARDSLLFFTKSLDPRLAVRGREERGNRGLFFQLLPRLLQLIRSVGVATILEETSFDDPTAEALLDFSEELNWSLPERSSVFV